MHCSDGIKAEICYHIERLESEELTETKSESIAFYSARGYNAWAGDIVNFYHDGVFLAVTYDELKEHGLYPGGANYMVSGDGIHFEQGKKQIHCSENPSIYADKNGGLTMYAGYACRRAVVRRQV